MFDISWGELLLIGVVALPRRVGPYLRELFPRRVREEEA